jgi:hypothetical protein
MSSHNDRIPKKAKPSDKPSKKCKLCKKYGDKPLTSTIPMGLLRRTLKGRKGLQVRESTFRADEEGVSGDEARTQVSQEA